MMLRILGSGTMVPTLHRYPAAYVLEEDETRVLLDCGFMTIPRLLEYSIEWRSISAVMVTHFHTDHFAHVLPLMHLRWSSDNVSGQTQEKLTLIGPTGLQEKLQQMREIMWPEPTEHYNLIFKEGPRVIELDSLTIESCPVIHVPWFQSLAYKITSRKTGATMAYTGDVGKHQEPAFEEFIRGVDTLLIEASTDVSADNHLSAQDALEWAQKSNIKQVVLTHVQEKHVPNIENFLSGNPNGKMAIVARDGMTLSI